MSVALLTAGTVMDSVNALLNDNARAVYTYLIQVPYLNMALTELREFLALNDVPVVNTKSALIAIPSGTSFLGYDGILPVKSLPDDMIEPVQVWQNTGGSGYSPIPIVKLLSSAYDGIATAGIIEVVWAGQALRFNTTSGIVNIKIDYLAQVVSPVVDETSSINLLTAQSFLQYRTAALIAKFVEENESRANELNGQAGLAIDRVLGLGTKTGQGMITRRRPFRAGYKNR